MIFFLIFSTKCTWFFLVLYPSENYMWFCTTFLENLMCLEISLKKSLPEKKNRYFSKIARRLLLTKKNHVHFVEKNQEKNQLKSQEKIKNQKNLVRLFFKCFTPRFWNRFVLEKSTCLFHSYKILLILMKRTKNKNNFILNS